MPAVVEEVHGYTGGLVGRGAGELRGEARQVFVAGRDGGDVHEHGACLLAEALLKELNEGARELPVACRRGVLGRCAGGQRRCGWSKEAIANVNAVVFDWEAGEPRPEAAQGVKGCVAGDVARKGQGFPWMVEQGRADRGGGAVPEQLEKAFRIDRARPCVGFGLEAVGAELEEQNAGGRIVGEEVVGRVSVTARTAFVTAMLQVRRPVVCSICAGSRPVIAVESPNTRTSQARSCMEKIASLACTQTLAPW